MAKQSQIAAGGKEIKEKNKHERKDNTTTERFPTLSADLKKDVDYLQNKYVRYDLTPESKYA